MPVYGVGSVSIEIWHRGRLYLVSGMLRLILITKVDGGRNAIWTSDDVFSRGLTRSNIYFRRRSMDLVVNQLPLPLLVTLIKC